MAGLSDDEVAGSAEALIDRPDLMGIVIATPARTHFDLAQRALEANKHVLVEKPLTLDEDDGMRLTRLAREQGLTLMVGHITLFHPAIAAIRSLIRSGALGRIQYLYSNRLNRGIVREEEDILWSFAPHDIAAMLDLLGSWPESVAAHGGSYLKAGRADVTTTHLAFPGGTRAHIFVSWLHPVKEHRMVVIGDRGMVVFQDERGGGQLMRYPSMNAVGHAGGTAPENILFRVREPLKEEVRHFVQCCTSGTQPRSGPLHGLRVLRILETARRSLELGGLPVDCDEVQLP